METEAFGWLDWMLTNWQTTILSTIFGVITVTSAVVKATPTKVDDGIWFKVLRLLELLSLNNVPVEKKE